MSSLSASALRLADSADSQAPQQPQQPSSSPAPATPHLQSPQRVIESLQEEILSLQDEVNMLRRRDETLKYYMHRVDEELRLAARLQRDFLPRTLPEVGNVRFHVLFRPATYVSGDIYDVQRLDETNVGIYIADAVGHGMPAALLTMFMKRALVTKEILTDGYRLLSPAETMSRLNDALVEQELTQATFATALYATIDTKTLTFKFARGGHPSPILLTAAGEVKHLEADGGLLGIFPGDNYVEGSAQLSKGDRLFIYTDGVEVAFSDTGDIDAECWQRELLDNANVPTDELLLNLSRRIDTETGSLQPKDDLTIVAAEVV
jgi:sigma-B regulation protein RsbU (phosphoserine phosphatase)